MKQIVLCADDYGQSAAISSGIMQLVQAGRLSAVSCMTESPFWKGPANTLPRYREYVDVGLHFNLTQSLPAPATPALPLPQVLLRALLGAIDGNVVERALHAQLDRFEAVMGTPPDFVDGHQHVHVFPQIRTRLLGQLAARYPKQKPYLRAVSPPLRGADGLLKLAFLKALGAGFARQAKHRGFSLSGDFAGIYSLRPEVDFAPLMRQWLAQVHSGDLIMCHPGLADSGSTDAIRATRPLELAFLRSAEFGQLLADQQIELARFSVIQRA